MNDDDSRCFDFVDRFSEPVPEDDEANVCEPCEPDQSSALGDSWCVYSEGACRRMVVVGRSGRVEGSRRRCRRYVQRSTLM